MKEKQEVSVTSMFSVPVFRIVCDGFSDEMELESVIKKELNKNMIPLPEKNGIYDGLDPVEQSYPELHLRKIVRPLCEKILDVSEYIAKDILFFDSSYKTEITGMWANRQKPGAALHTHRHHNNIFAGIFYISDGDFPPITFLNPCDPQMKPNVTQFNSFNSRSWHIPVLKDTLLIFPAHVDHTVESNKSDKDRYSISFNIMFRGQYSSRESLESVIL